MSVHDKFGYDFLWTMRELMFRRNVRSFDQYADSVAKFCLVQSGMSVDEVDKVNEQFFNRLERENLGSYSEALERLISSASKDVRTQECIISSLAAVATTQVGEISEEQREFMHGFRELLDMKPSQFQQALQRGVDLAVALNYSARQYVESGRL
jgi:hypothetical protein